MGEICTELTGLNNVINEAATTPIRNPPFVSSYAPDTKAWGSQKDGNHYKTMKIQTMEYTMANKFNSLQHSVIKYVSRYPEKNGVADLVKARHCIDMLIDWETKYSHDSG